MLDRINVSRDSLFALLLFFEGGTLGSSQALLLLCAQKILVESLGESFGMLGIKPCQRVQGKCLTCIVIAPLEQRFLFTKNFPDLKKISIMWSMTSGTWVVYSSAIGLYPKHRVTNIENRRPKAQQPNFKTCP